MGWFCTLLIVGSDLHNGGGAVGGEPGQAVRPVDAGVAGEDVGPAVLSAEHSPLGKGGQTAQRHRPGGADGGIGQDPVEEGDVHTVVMPVKGYRLHINVGIHQLGLADPDIRSSIQKLLRGAGQINSQILDAILVAAGIGDFSHVNGHGVLALFAHGDPSCHS